MSFSRPFSILLVIAAVLFGCKKDDDPLQVNNSVSPNDFLSDKNYTTLNVEMVYMEGSQAASASVDNLKAFLQARLTKSTVTISPRIISAGANSSYTIDQIKDLEKTNRQMTTSGKNLTAFFIFVNGDYAGNSGSAKVLGVAYGNSSMAIFEKTIKEFGGGVGKPSLATLETTVLNHEFGHILGLVNTGTSMVTSHQDGAHGGHCNVQDCLMYYTAETSDVVGNLLGGTVPSLDANCVADLKANGGK